jgi:transcriptional regulator with XRE-family HTH domain
MSGSARILAALVQAEIAASGRTQAEVAAEVGITPKHLSQFVSGHCGMSLDLVDLVLRSLGRGLVLATLVVDATPIPHDQLSDVVDEWSP